MAEPSLGKCSHSPTGVILIPPAGVLLPVCAQHDSTGRCWDVLISCLKPAGPTADSCGKSDILTALIWNSFQWTGKAGVLLLMNQQNWSVAPNHSKRVHALILFLGFCPGRKNRSAGGNTPKLLYGRVERAQRNEPSDCPGGSRCSSKHNQFKSHANLTPHQGGSLILSGSNPNAHQSLFNCLQRCLYLWSPWKTATSQDCNPLEMRPVSYAGAAFQDEGYWLVITEVSLVYWR